MKTKRLWMAPMAALFLITIAGGCKKDNFVETVGICPLVINTDPGNNAVGVPLDKVITVTFNEPMNPVSITPESFSVIGSSKGSDAELAGKLTYDGNSAEMSFAPAAKLTAGTTYTARVLSTVKDLTGNALQTDYIWTFTTGTTISPVVISTDPSDLATGVFLNKTATITFNEPMDPLTFSATTFLVNQGTTPVQGKVTYSGTTAYFKPFSDLSSNTVYTAIVTTGVRNLSGTALGTDYVWTFTTGTISAPKVTTIDPLDQSSGIARNKVVSAVFSETMDPLTFTTSSFTLKIGTSPVTGTVNYAGTTATFTPAGGLLSGTTYTATITTAVKNPVGTPIANNYVWSFSTISPAGPNSVNLNSVGRFGIIAGVGVSNLAGFSVINDLDVGIYPGVRSSITGFPPAIIVNGGMYASDDLFPAGISAMLLQAKNDLVAAYLFAEGAISPSPVIVSGDQGGKTLAPGIYKTTSTLLIQAGDLTLDAQGDINAVWIFQVASGFTTVGGAGGNVILAGGAQAKNIYWQTGSSATIGDYTAFKGNILALQSITMNPYATVKGRMLARNGSVVMTSTNIINKP